MTSTVENGTLEANMSPCLDLSSACEFNSVIEGGSPFQSLEDLCENIDATVCTFMEDIKNYFMLKDRLCKLMYDGNLCLSKARYLMGVSKVSANQIPDREFEALLRCEVDSTSDEPVFLALRMTSKDKVSNNSMDSKESNLRRRNIDKGNHGKTRESAFTEREVDNIKSVEIEDPLKWFGVLVPSTLRQSQSFFQEAVKVICDLASCEMLLKRHVKSYRSLLRMKKKMSKE